MKERIDSVRAKFNRGITRCGCAVYTGIDNLINENTFQFFQILHPITLQSNMRRLQKIIL